MRGRKGKARSTAEEGGPPLRAGGEGGGLLLPGAPRAAGVRFCCPVRPDRAFDFVTLAVRRGVTQQSRAPRYRWHLCDGPSRWSHSGRKLRFSTHVDPGSAPSAEPQWRHASRVLAARLRWWSRRVLPPGPLRLLYATLYRHSRLASAVPI